MRKVKRFLKVGIIALGLSAFIFGLFYVSFKVWRAEHPNAPTWTFFIKTK